MNNLTVFNRNGQLYTDSREVAKMIGKDHAHLMRDIDGYISVLGQSKIGFSELFRKSTIRQAVIGETWKELARKPEGSEAS